MAYTASALAFLLHDLNKPVVVTGAQIPLCEYSSDATNNFRGALLSAGMGDLPGESRRRLSVEVMVRGNVCGLMSAGWGAKCRGLYLFQSKVDARV